MSCPDRKTFVTTAPGTFTTGDQHRRHRASLGRPQNRNMHAIGVMGTREKSFHELWEHKIGREWDEGGHKDGVIESMIPSI